MSVTEDLITMGKISMYGEMLRTWNTMLIHIGSMQSKWNDVNLDIYRRFWDVILSKLER